MKNHRILFEIVFDKNYFKKINIHFYKYFITFYI